MSAESVRGRAAEVIRQNFGNRSQVVADALAAAGLLAGEGDGEALSVILDPEAFAVHAIEERSQAAALQWAARRHLAREHADRAMAAGWHR